MKEPAAKPTTIELPMKPRDRTAACPDETRCQLELIWDDGRGALTVHDGPRDSKLVQIGLIGEKGCDAKVRVGLIESGGPIAVGGQPVDDGSGGVVYQLWERRLQGCIDPERMYLNKMPFHTLNVRYVGRDDSVSLVVAQLHDGDYLVSVERRGPLPVEPLRLNYANSDDGLVVSAAMSRDLQALYVVVSRQSGSSVSATYYYYTYNRYAGVWVLFRGGAVPRPSDLTSYRAYHVDREGLVAGYFATAISTSLEYYQDDGTCLYPVVLPGERWSRTTSTYDIYGGKWSIIDRTWSNGQRRRSGQVVQKGDYVPIEEAVISGIIHSSYDKYSWAIETSPEGNKIWHRAQEVRREDALSFSLALPEVSMITEDDGARLLFAGRAVQEAIAYPEENLATNITDYYFDAYSNSDGHVGVSVTPGGWVVAAKNRVVTLVDRSPRHFEVSYPLMQGGSGSLGNASCPALLSIAEETASELQEESQQIIYPVSLGDYHIVHRSFTAIDTESGDVFCGALVQLSEESSSVWRIFKNFSDVTGGVAACIGRPLDQFAAIYWRA